MAQKRSQWLSASDHLPCGKASRPPVAHSRVPLWLFRARHTEAQLHTLTTRLLARARRRALPCLPLAVQRRDLPLKLPKPLSLPPLALAPTSMLDFPALTLAPTTVVSTVHHHHRRVGVVGRWRVMVRNWRRVVVRCTRHTQAHTCELFHVKLTNHACCRPCMLAAQAPCLWLGCESDMLHELKGPDACTDLPGGG